MTLPADIDAVVSPVLDRYACDLVLGTFGREHEGLILRLLIERKNTDHDSGSGVDHKLCSSISRDIGSVLEVEDTITKAFTLEVSSPGIERPLVKPEDFERFSGRRMTAKLREAIDSRYRFTGELMGLHEGSVVVKLERDREVSIPLDKIKKAHLVYDPK